MGEAQLERRVLEMFVLLGVLACASDPPPAPGPSSAGRAGSTGGSAGAPMLGGSSGGGAGGNVSALLDHAIQRCKVLCGIEDSVCEMYDLAACTSSCDLGTPFFATDGCLAEYDAQVTCLSNLTPSDFVCFNGNNPVQMAGLCATEIETFETCFAML